MMTLTLLSILSLKGHHHLGQPVSPKKAENARRRLVNNNNDNNTKTVISNDNNTKIVISTSNIVRVRNPQTNPIELTVTVNCLVLAGSSLMISNLSMSGGISKVYPYSMTKLRMSVP